MQIKFINTSGFLFFILLVFLGNTIFSSCTGNKSNTSENPESLDSITTNNIDSLPLVDNDLADKLRLKDFDGAPVWEHDMTSAPMNYKDRFADETTIRFEGDFFILNNQEFKVRATATTLDKITDIKPFDREKLTSYIISNLLLHK